jgi:ferredoxin-type protein NapH
MPAGARRSRREQYALAALLLAPLARAQQPAEPLPPDPRPLPSVQHCPVEGDPVTDGRYGALWQGRRYYTEREECLAAFLEDPETYARELEPRAALFAPANPARPAMGVSLLAVALVFVLALLSAGVASYGCRAEGSERNGLVLGILRGDRYAWLGVSFLACYTVYGVKVGAGSEFWPFRGWGYQALSLLGRPWSFWYTVLYTLLMTVFGLQALKRWGLERKDKFQIWRFVSLLGFQWIFFFLVPEFLFQWAVKYQWLGELARDPKFADQAWRSYELVYAWPLFFYTFFYDPHWVWVVWGVVLTFVLIPLVVLFHGKRYCSWVCGCGGLAETFGDRWRHLAPKGKESYRWETMNLVILIAAVLVTGGMLAKDLWRVLAGSTNQALGIYRLFVDVWLVGILPVTLYPFLGGKIWCRYWCPLAKFMNLLSAWYGKFKITANDKCIACGECTRYCQVGIDVMNFALKQNELTNRNSSCIGCGICVTACPMDVLSFGGPAQPLVQIQAS